MSWCTEHGVMTCTRLLLPKFGAACVQSTWGSVCVLRQWLLGGMEMLARPIPATIYDKNSVDV